MTFLSNAISVFALVASVSAIAMAFYAGRKAYFLTGPSELSSEDRAALIEDLMFAAVPAEEAALGEESAGEEEPLTGAKEIDVETDDEENLSEQPYVAPRTVQSGKEAFENLENYVSPKASEVLSTWSGKDQSRSKVGSYVLYKYARGENLKIGKDFVNVWSRLNKEFHKQPDSALFQDYYKRILLSPAYLSPVLQMFRISPMSLHNSVRFFAEPREDISAHKDAVQMFALGAALGSLSFTDNESKTILKALQKTDDLFEQEEATKFLKMLQRNG